MAVSKGNQKDKTNFLGRSPTKRHTCDDHIFQNLRIIGIWLDELLLIVAARSAAALARKVRLVELGIKDIKRTCS